MINESVEVKMDLIRDLISLGRNAREDVKIKVRQPISEVILDGKNKDIIADSISLIKEELNVKQIVFEDDLDKYINFIIKPNFKEVGKILGSKIRLFQDKLSNLTNEDKMILINGNSLNIILDDERFEVKPEMIEIRVESKDGFNASYEGDNFVILNTVLTNELINEGLARETISKIQQIRKNNGFEITDRVKVFYDADMQYVSDIQNFVDFIKDETLATEFTKGENLDQEYDINDYKVKLSVIKNKN